jgi:hypothetical protein
MFFGQFKELGRNAKGSYYQAKYNADQMRMQTEQRMQSDRDQLKQQFPNHPFL